jgi:hypothetical protein
MKSHRSKILVLLSILALTLAACSPSSTSTPSRVIDLSRPLSQQVSVSPLHFEEAGEAPKYKITADVPTIIGVDDPRVKAFNDLTYTHYQRFVGELQDALQSMPVEPVSGGSTLDVRYELVSPPGEIISLKYLITGYADGEPQPFHNIITINFNIETGQEVQLDSLFLAGSNYLQALSTYCAAELTSRKIGFEAFASGADPSPENYQHWNITADGLVITFDEYQVADSAAGQQAVSVPYSALKDLIDPQGPLGKYIQ